MAVTTCVIKQFGVVSVGKFFAVVGLLWGFFMGIFIAAGISGMGSLTGHDVFGFGAGLVGLILLIAIGGMAGFISGALMALVYNTVLGAIGGIEMDLELKGQVQA
jgi:hypothetical protein